METSLPEEPKGEPGRLTPSLGASNCEDRKASQSRVLQSESVD